MNNPLIAVFSGGTSSERDVSIGSGLAVAAAVARCFPTKLYRIDRDELPSDLDVGKHIVLSTLHGGFGENGGMQALLEKAGVSYAGCDAASSALTMDKTATKEAVAAKGVTVAPGIQFFATDKPTVEQVIAVVGEKAVFKPNDQGSSVGLVLTEKANQIEAALAGITDGGWLVEKRIFGRELSVGVLNGRAMGVVEIRPKSGVYDFQSKYTRGMTSYLAPAPLNDQLTEQAQAAAAAAYQACGCRDYARVDFILSHDGPLYLLEINTLPGMKETSLLPMSAGCVGLDFTALVREMITPALQRFKAAS